MARFCGKCGTPVDEKTGKCPNCDVGFSDGAKKKKKGSVTLVLIVVILIIMLAATATVYFMFFGGLRGNTGGNGDSTSKNTNTEQTDEPSESDETEIDLGQNFEVPEFDADEYYENNSDLKKTISVRKSDTVSSEREVYDLLYDRGFDAAGAYYEYLIDGTYCGQTRITRYGSDEHPMYQCFYTSRDGSSWLVTEANGDLFAMYLSYDADDVNSARLIVSESDTITSYDGTANKYYINVPDSAQAVIKKVKTLDAEMLDDIAKEVND